MKVLMLLGAVLGFGVGAGFSLIQKNPGATVIWHAAVAAYVAGLLLRWWGRSWEKCLRAALLEKQAQDAKAASESNPTHR